LPFFVLHVSFCCAPEIQASLRVSGAAFFATFLWTKLIVGGLPVMKISRAEVEHVSRLARLALSDQELDAIRQDMDKILDYVEQLNQLDTAGIIPTAHAVPMENAFREDVIRPGFTREQALANAPDPDPSGFRVPRVIE
jgi:aspartyl-tRNA(Asn)/glutamyl-tRNA(Gln) amidotransferase subunit C